VSWRDEALCRGKHTDLWFPPFPDERSVPEKSYYEIAKMVCEHCPVQSQCLESGVDEEFGVFGGRTPRERAGKEEHWEPTYRLVSGRYLKVIPSHSREPLDTPAIMADVKRYSDKR
jgi:hypothetical protein